MIDLRQRGLPNTITVDGKPFLIKTNFREWLQFGELLKKGTIYNKDIEYLFDGKRPLVNCFDELLDFFINESPTPKKTGSTSERIVDFVLDGEYIVASFQQAYGIDLTDIEYLHWHRFLALFNGLPENTKMVEIMGYRGWRKTTEKQETFYQKQKDRWRLPPITQQNDKELLEEINAEFYNC